MMRTFTKKEIENLNKVERLNLINSLTGYKSANLIGTISKNKITNLAIFSSITHLGSNPALISFILRPTTVPRNTYENIKDNGFFSVNHISYKMIKDAHHTSAKYDDNISEFDKTNLNEAFYDNIDIPFVKESPIKLLCKYLNEYEIKENGCLHIIASIEKVFIDEKVIHKDLWIQLDLAEIITINGLDGYALPKIIDRFKYAKPDQQTTSILKQKTDL